MTGAAMGTVTPAALRLVLPQPGLALSTTLQPAGVTGARATGATTSDCGRLDLLDHRRGHLNWSRLDRGNRFRLGQSDCGS